MKLQKQTVWAKCEPNEATNAASKENSTPLWLKQQTGYLLTEDELKEFAKNMVDLNNEDILSFDAAFFMLTKNT